MDADGSSGSASPNTSQASLSVSPASSHSSATLSLAPHLSEGAAKVISNVSNYLPLGCFCFEDLFEFDSTEELNVWQEVTSFPVLAFDSGIGSNLSKLLDSGWIRIQSSRCSLRRQWLIFRIYLLYHDVGLATIDRKNKRLLSAVERIVHEVNTDFDTWQGRYNPNAARRFDAFATREEENPSLFYLFNKLTSPAPSADDISEKYDRESLEDLLDSDFNIAGLKTNLYPFQRRSAGAMLYRETVSRFQFDPRYEKRKAPSGHTFYYSPRDLEFLRDPKYFEACRGGILAESMGLGKTVICLALILSTKDHPPKIPAEHTTPPVRPKVCSLSEMAVSAINRRSFPWKVELERIRRAGQDMASCEDALSRNPPSYDIPVVPIRWNRKTTLPPPHHITTASTTIIVVPQNLCKQWASEIAKHVEPGVLKVKIMDDRKVLLPPPEELRKYDIVLFTRSRFDMEIQDGQDSDGRRMSKVPLGCQCAYRGATRTRDCNCLREKDLYDSPLKHLHFKRLIVDEGHFFSSGNNTSTIIVANRLVKADHRWVVSGTPAKDLLGVEVDMQSLENGDRGVVLDQRRYFDSKHDRFGAIESLTSLAGNFLRCTPWSANDAKNYIYRHEDLRDKTYSGFSTALRRLMESIVVKTQPDDVDRDIGLPPISHKVVLLQPSFYDKLTANMFNLVLTANAVTSERTDTDYLFHKNSRKERLQLVGNLRQSAFFWTGFSEADVHTSVKNSTGYLVKKGTGCPPEDRELLIHSMQCADTMLGSNGWKSMSKSHELGVFIDGWPEESAEHWAFDRTAPLLTGISHLLDAQRFVNQRTKEIDPGDGLSGAGIKSLSATHHEGPQVKVERQEDDSKKSDSKPLKPDVTKSGIPVSSITGEPTLRRRPSLSGGSKTTSPRKGKVPTKMKKPPIKTPKPETIPEQDRTVASGSSLPTTSYNAELALPSFSEDSAYAKARIVGTTSSKLSYLISQILEHYLDEKILVFYQGDNPAYYISQFLELFHINHEIYARSLQASLKSDYVLRFQEQDDLRVLLMDVSQAAFGLNICAASRVYFVNPVCRPNVEAQAIKRAHRIGQTRKVTVETLVLKDSIEEKMLERSKNMLPAEHLDAKALEDDGGIRAIIQSARTLSLAEGEEVPGSRQMAPLAKPERLWCRPGWHLTVARPIRKRKRGSDPTESTAGNQQPLTGGFKHPQVQVKRVYTPTRNESPSRSVSVDSDNEPLVDRWARREGTRNVFFSMPPDRNNTLTPFHPIMEDETGPTASSSSTLPETEYTSNGIPDLLDGQLS